MSDLLLGHHHLGALVEDTPLDGWRRDQQWAMPPVVSQVRSGVDGDSTWTLLGLLGIDGLNAGMSERAANEGDVTHVGQVDVVDEQGLARQQSRVFISGEALAKVPGCHPTTPVSLEVIFLRKGDQGVLENFHGRPYQAGPDLAHTGLAVGDAGIDAWWQTQFHDLANIDTRRGAAKVQLWNREVRVLGCRDLVHLQSGVQRIPGCAADEGDDGGCRCHGKAADPDGLGDGGIADVGIGIGAGESR